MRDSEDMPSQDNFLQKSEKTTAAWWQRMMTKEDVALEAAEGHWSNDWPFHFCLGGVLLARRLFIFLICLTLIASTISLPRRLQIIPPRCWSTHVWGLKDDIFLWAWSKLRIAKQYLRALSNQSCVRACSLGFFETVFETIQFEGFRKCICEHLVLEDVRNRICEHVAWECSKPHFSECQIDWIYERNASI